MFTINNVYVYISDMGVTDLENLTEVISDSLISSCVFNGWCLRSTLIDI